MILFLLFHKIIGDFNYLKKKFNLTQNNYKKRFYRAIVKFYNHESNSYLPLYIKNNGTINFVHSYSGIFISGSAEIGENVTIYQNVTIGSVRQIDSKLFGAPTIGKNVILGAGCKVIGKVKIGDNCRIAPNAFVNRDLPDNTIFIDSNNIINREVPLINRVYQNSGKNWVYLENGEVVKENNINNIKALNDKI